MHRVALRAGLLTAVLVSVLQACGTTGTASPTPPTVTASPPPASAALPPSSTPNATATATLAVSTPPVGLNGTWNGTWQDTSPDQAGGTFVLTWTQNGSALAGNIVVKGTPCLSAATVTGSVNGSSISFGAVSGTNTVTYNGTISGDTMKGGYTAPSACEDAQGTWTATRH